LNAYWDSLVTGTRVTDIIRATSAIGGVPLVRNTGEIVEVILEDSDKLRIITSLDVYEFHPSSTPIVSVGDTLNAGDLMVDTVSVIELSSQTADLSRVPATAVNDSFLSGGYFSEIVFENKTVTLDYLGLDAGGKAIVEFELSGYPGDLEVFWDKVHENGVANGKVLAEYLDPRENPGTPPVPSILPSTINPLQFVLENIMRNNLFVITLKPSQFQSGVPDLDFLRTFREIVPPHTTFLIFLTAASPVEYFSLVESGTEASPGAGEDSEPLLVSNRIDESFTLDMTLGSAAPSYKDVSVRARLVSGVCK